MLLILDTTSSVPLYQQIVEEIRAKVLTGELEPGDPLPSIRQLAADLVTSVITTKRAYQELESQGLIQTQQGRGTFIANVDQALAQRMREDEVRLQLREVVRRAGRLGIKHTVILKLLQDALKGEEFEHD